MQKLPNKGYLQRNFVCGLAEFLKVMVLKPIIERIFVAIC